MDALVTGAAALFLGAFGKEAAVKVVEKFFPPKNGDRKLKQYEAVALVKEGVKEELKVGVVPLLEANQKSLDSIATTNVNIDKGIATLIALYQANR